MPLHSKAAVRDALDDDVYASSDLSVAVPKYRFPQHEQLPRHAYSIVHDELMLDGNSRMNLATFCQTWLEPEIYQLMGECIDKNMIDRDEYPQTAEIESRCGPHAGRLVALAGSGQHGRLLDHRLERSLHARRTGRQVAVARAAEARRQNAGHAQHRLGRRASLLAQVRPLFRSRRAPRPAGRRATAP